ncbi:hypothetical protein [Psychromonas sp.]|uniref:hypothetical protein n=1 Tax=Psychromonas sp. TaxID=1884585 RepID=UPI00356446EF
MRIPIVVFLCALLNPSAFSETTITVNDRTIRSSGNNITVSNNTVMIDGRILSGNVLQGSGKIVSENRNPGEFEVLRLGIAAEVTVINNGYGTAP